jgi:hypothetical protein
VCSGLKDRWRWAAVMLALAALTKEMTLAVAAGIGLAYLFQRSWMKLFAFSVIVLLPFVIWRLCCQWFGQPGIGSGGALAHLNGAAAWPVVLAFLAYSTAAAMMIRYCHPAVISPG